MNLLQSTRNEQSRLLTLVFTDLVDSVGLKLRLGDSDADKLISMHFEGLINRLNWTGGREILVTGDGAFLAFEIPSKAVEFALQLQEFHHEYSNLPKVRIGIHMGEVTERLIVKAGVEQVEILGLAVDLASRIQSLALPGQVLMSYPVFDNARQRLDSTVISHPVEWRAHGSYVFQGIETALEMFEVGATGTAPFVPPAGGSKAQRVVLLDDEEVLGWRPAQGQPMPSRPHWILSEKLGEGGFGDVWLIENTKTRQRHVVKFCYCQEKLRTLKREVTLFRLMKEYLGDRPDVARLIDFQFDSSPYYLEMEFAGKHNLTAWIQHKGGIENIPMDHRLELVAQMADAIAAAHSVGVLHKDIKPSNVMVTESDSKTPRIRMIDFGIGTLSDRTMLEDKGITVTGLTEFTSTHDSGSSMTGTRLFMAPELIEGKAATIKSDIYSLGVVLYQLASGKLGQALSFGWERDIANEFVREDIRACVDGAPANRLSSANELARRLRSIPQRQAERKREQDQLTKQELARKRRKMYFLLAGLLGVMMVFFAQFAFLQKEKAETAQALQKRAEDARKEAEIQTEKTRLALLDAQKSRYVGAIALAEASLREYRLDKVQQVLLNEAPEQFRNREWGWLLSQISPEDMSLSRRNIFDLHFLSDGKRFVTGRRDHEGKGVVAVNDLATGKETMQILTNNRLVWNLDVSPDETYVATASSDHVVAVADISSGTVVHKLTGHRDIVRDVAFSPDGTRLASAGRDDIIILWSVPDFATSQTIYQPGDKFTEITYSPDSRFLASAALNGNVRIYSTTSGEQIGNCIGNTDRVLSILALRDNKSLVTASSDGSVRVYNWPTDYTTTSVLPRLTLNLKDSAATHLASTREGRSFYVAQDNGVIRKFNTNTGAEQNTIQVDQQLWKIVVNSEGDRMFSIARWSARLLNLDRLEERIRVTELDHISSAPQNALHIKIATVTQNRDRTWRADEKWRSNPGLYQANIGNQAVLLESAYRIYSPDGKLRVTVHPANLRPRVFSTETEKEVADLKHIGFVNGNFSADGSLFAVASQTSGTIVYDTSTWRPRYITERQPNGPNFGMFTRDSRLMVEGNVDGSARLMDAADGTVKRNLLRPGGGSVLSCDISPDGKLAALGLETNYAVIVNLETGDTVSTMSGHVNYVHDLKFTPEGDQLVTMSRDGTVKLWDISSGRELVTLFNLGPGVVPVGLAFDPMGQYIAVATSERRMVTTNIFPSRSADYGGSADVPLDERIELWKRKTRLNPTLTLQDL